jgi:hypothetical protein
MARSELAGSGGIIGLSRFIREHREPLQYDLLQAGLRLENLGTLSLSWWDVHVFIEHAPRGSALVRAVNGDELAEWTGRDELLRSMEFSLRWLVWAQSKDSQKGINVPAPLDPPSKPKPKPVMSLDPGDESGPHVIGHAGVTLERMAEILGWDPETGQRLDVP